MIDFEFLLNSFEFFLEKIFRNSSSDENFQTFFIIAYDFDFDFELT